MKDKIEKVEIHKERLEEKYRSLSTRIAQLTAAGCIDAKEYWKDNKYLYLLRPMKNGKRLKTYVGNHPLRIEEARQKVINFKKRKAIVKQQDEITKEIVTIESLVKQLFDVYLKSKILI